MSFPPQSKREEEINALLNMLGSVIDDKNATYVGAPITSGKRLIEWRVKQNGSITYKVESCEEHPQEVVNANRAHARDIIRTLREKCDTVLIDPTSFEDLQGWTQDDYRDLWARAIKKYARKVVLIDGWEYSNGCAFEFLVAQQNGIPIFDERHRSLSLSDGLQKIETAISEMQSHNIPTDFLKSVVRDLITVQQQKVEARYKN